MTNIWIRNADRAMSNLVSEGVSRITWTRQHLSRLRMDGISFVRQFYMHTPIRPRIMIIGVQNTSEYTTLDSIEHPRAVYPTWAGKHDTVEELIDFIENPWGESEEKCLDLSVPTALRPIYGQPHRVVIHNNPPAISGIGLKYWLMIDRIQQDYPEVELFINGSSSFNVLFGLKFKAADFGLCDAGDRNQTFTMPNGMFINLAHPRDLVRLRDSEPWVRMLGFTVNEILANQNRRFAFRIRAAQWAAKHYASNYRFKRAEFNFTDDELKVGNDDYKPRSSSSIVVRRKVYTVKEAEKILCDRCSIAPNCKVYRAGAICGLKGSEMGELEKYFQSRDAGKIIDGLAELTKLQARRLEATMDEEAKSGDVDPDVTRQMNSLFSNGTKLAKLVNPELAGPGTRVQVNVGTAGNTEIVSTANPRELVAAAVRALEDRGIPREQITPTMLKGLLSGMASATQQQALTSQVVAHEEVQKDRGVIEGTVTKEPVPALPFQFRDNARDD
jgi:hypothetical protein